MIPLAELRAAVTADHPAAALEELVRREFRAGRGRDEVSENIADLLPGLRASPGYDDRWEDHVVELVDRLTGWTHPNSQLHPESHPANGTPAAGPSAKLPR